MGATEGSGPAEEDRGREWPGESPRTRVDWGSRERGSRFRGAWEARRGEQGGAGDGADHGADRPSRLGARRPGGPDPEAVTRRMPPPRHDPEAETRRVPGPRHDPEAATKVRPGGGAGRFDPEADTEVVRPRSSDGPSWQDSIGPGPSPSGRPVPGGGAVPGGGPTPDAGPAPGGGPGPRGGPVEDDFPDALRDRFTPLGRAGAGAEGTVWYVRRTDGGADAAVKVSAVGQPMDHDLLAHLCNDGFRRHVPHLIDYGRVRHHGALVDWVAMEYLPVTLSAHVAALRRSGAHADPRTTEQIVYELVSLLEFWQRRIQRNPLDFKPANILVRPGRGPGEFVIADFGGVDRLTDSRRFTSTMMVTVAYMAPEQLAGKNHEAGPWWGLGNVLYELFVGRPRFVGADGERAADHDLELELVMGEEVDLAAVIDQRQLLLLQGLFTKKPEDRWTAAEVRSWLAGGSPEVIRRRPRARRPITFLGDPFTDPVRLTEVLLRNSGAAARWLAAVGAERLRDWLRDEVKDPVFDLHYLTDVVRAPGSRREAVAGVAVLALGAAYAPSAVPHYRDRPVDPVGLERVATEPDGAAFIDELVRGGAPAVAARYDCFHPECSGEHCSRLLALAALPEVLAEVERTARTVGGGRRGDGGLGPEEREEAHRLAVWLSIRPEERYRLLGRLSPLPAALHRLPLPVRVSELAAVVASAVVDGALTAGAGVRTAVRSAARRPAPDPAAATPRDVVRRRWSALRRRAVGADPGQVAGRAALVAAEAVRRRGRGRVERPEPEPGVLREGRARAGRMARLWAQRRRRPPVDWPARLRLWWPYARTMLPRRAGAVALLVVGLGLLLWAGAVVRFPVEAGHRLDLSPDLFGGPLRLAGRHAAEQAAGKLGAAFTAAAVLAFFPAPVGFGTALLTGAGAFAIGYLRLGPPMTAVEAPQPVADRVVMFEGGMGSWAGIAAVVAVVVAVVLIERGANRLLKPAQQARRRVREAWRDLDRRAARAARVAGGGTGSGAGSGTGPRTGMGPRTGTGAGTEVAGAWRTGRAGTRDRLRFALTSTGVLVLLLWAAVEVRLAATGVHRTPESWGTGQTGAAYQAGFVVLLAAVSLLSTLGTLVTARVLFVGWILGTLFLGAWPGVLGPVEALRIPVVGARRLLGRAAGGAAAGGVRGAAGGAGAGGAGVTAGSRARPARRARPTRPARPTCRAQPTSRESSIECPVRSTFAVR
ncbi:hypothetical protein ABTY61_17690 [Kitasatospora sp. NPDC096128]|uniref:protein kinase domain-containing protein n=1 Tax=Kitasatospora sp. NPDC096128 TaxID=3155547 RepID=UPI0033299C62